MIQKKTSTLRRLAMQGFELVAGGHNFYALLEFDISELRNYLRSKRQRGEGGTLFAFIIKAIAECLKEFPVFNAMIDLRKTTIFPEIDINIPIEIERNGEYFTKQCIIRDANLKTVKQISDAIDASKSNKEEELGFVQSKAAKRLLSIMPGGLMLLLFRMVLSNHTRVKETSGTVFVTSVSMFSNVPGYVIPFTGGPKAVSFAIGSSIRKPVVIKDSITVREMLNITVAFNHDIIDGAPAARFINKLRAYIENDYMKIIK